MDLRCPKVVEPLLLVNRRSVVRIFVGLCGFRVGQILAIGNGCAIASRLYLR